MGLFATASGNQSCVAPGTSSDARTNETQDVGRRTRCLAVRDRWPHRSPGRSCPRPPKTKPPDLASTGGPAPLHRGRHHSDRLSRRPSRYPHPLTPATIRSRVVASPSECRDPPPLSVNQPSEGLPGRLIPPAFPLSADKLLTAEALITTVLRGMLALARRARVLERKKGRHPPGHLPISRGDMGCRATGAW